MLFYTGLLFLVVAVSLDGFGVGITYGMRKIHVPFIALLIIMFCSGLIVLLSMTIGGVLGAFISPSITKSFGGLILISLGVFSLVNIIRSNLHSDKEKEVSKKKLHVFKSVLTTPDKADLDRSGVISANEALLLGSALALDAFGAGLGASIIGYSPLLTSTLIALMSGLFFYSGIKTGLMLFKSKHLQQLAFIAPILLIGLGVFHIL